MVSLSKCNYHNLLVHSVTSFSRDLSPSFVIDRSKLNNLDTTRNDTLQHSIHSFTTIKNHRTRAPTLATGRRSKFIKLEGDAALKREVRRKRNREAARKLKEKRVSFEQGLENKIQQLKQDQQSLLSLIDDLNVYKSNLEERCHNYPMTFEEIRKMPLKKQVIARNRITDYMNHRNLDSTDIKTEPQSSSAQWQLAFRI